MDRTIPAPGELKRGRKTCQTCVIAKAKCITAAGGNGKCDRCRRLEKDCSTPPPTARKLRTRRPTRVDHLEKTVQGLVTILASSAPPQPDSDHGRETIPASIPKSPPVSACSHAGDCCLKHGSDMTSACLGYEYPVGGSAAVKSLLKPHRYDIQPGSIEAQTLLNKYQSQFCEYFPFVIIPPNITPMHLRKTKPFLYKTIMMAAISQGNSTRRNMMGDQIMTEMSEVLILRGEHSLDLLQGLLVFAAWCGKSWHINSQVTYIIHLIRALVVELGLNRAPPSPGRQKANQDNVPTIRYEQRKPHTLEEQRALAGCFYLTEGVTVSFKRYDTFILTPYLDDCCHALTDIGEYPSDELLVHLVRVQQLGNKIRQILPHEASPYSKSTNGPTGLYVKEMQHEVARLRASLPLDLQLKSCASINLSSVESALYEQAIHEPPISNSYGDHTIQRVDMLHACLLSVKALFDAFLLIPSSTYPSLPFLTWMQLGNSTLLASRLTRPYIEGWDATYARTNVNLPDILDQLQAKLRETNARTQFELPESREESILVRYEQSLELIKNWYNKQIAAELENETQPVPDWGLENWNFDFLNDDWFRFSASLGDDGATTGGWG